jgi:ferredoxin
MIAFYGFKDGSGDWFLSLDTEICNGCGKCIVSCPSQALEIADDEYDPFREGQVARVKEAERKKLRYTCAPCRPGYGEAEPPCHSACESQAITHSEGWKILYGQ